MLPRDSTVARTSDVRAVGEKTASAPDWRRTEARGGEKVSIGGLDRGSGVERRCIPIVPLPPTLIRPKRAKGAEQMVMLGEILRITITLAGSEGMSFDVIMRFEKNDAILFVRYSYFASETTKVSLKTLRLSRDSTRI